MSCSDSPTSAELCSSVESANIELTRAVPFERLNMELAFLAVPLESLQLRRVGENLELYFQKNRSDPYSGLAYENHPNDQLRLLFSINAGKVFSAKGWNQKGEPNQTLIKSGKGFVIELDDPEVGYVYENGLEIAYQGMTDNGKLFRISFIDGENIRYHANGKKWEQGIYENGLREGTWREWNVKGTLIKETNYSNGLYDGVCREWNEKGTNRVILHFKKGKLEGMWTVYDNEGRLSDIMVFSDGVAEGKWKSFHDNGKLEFEGNFCNDLKDGWHVWFDRRGRVTRRKYFSKGEEVQ